MGRDQPEITDDQVRLLRVMADPCSRTTSYLSERERTAIAAADREHQRLLRRVAEIEDLCRR